MTSKKCFFLYFLYLGVLGLPLGSKGEPKGAFGLPLGCFLEPLGIPWVTLGLPLELLGSLWEPIGLPLVHLGGSWDAFGCPLDPLDPFGLPPLVAEGLAPSEVVIVSCVWNICVYKHESACYISLCK